MTATTRLRAVPESRTTPCAGDPADAAGRARGTARRVGSLRGASGRGAGRPHGGVPLPGGHRGRHDRRARAWREPSRPRGASRPLRTRRAPHHLRGPGPPLLGAAGGARLLGAGRGVPARVVPHRRPDGVAPPAGPLLPALRAGPAACASSHGAGARPHPAAPPARPGARPSQHRRPLRPGQRLLRAVPRRDPHLQQRLVRLTGGHAGRGVVGEDRPDVPGARPAPGPARRRDRHGLGLVRPPRRDQLRRRSGHHDVVGRAAPGRDAARGGGRAGRPGRGALGPLPRPRGRLRRLCRGRDDRGGRLAGARRLRGAHRAVGAPVRGGGPAGDRDGAGAVRAGARCPRLHQVPRVPGQLDPIGAHDPGRGSPSHRPGPRRPRGLRPPLRRDAPSLADEPRRARRPRRRTGSRRRLPAPLGLLPRVLRGRVRGASGERRAAGAGAPGSRPLAGRRLSGTARRRRPRRRRRPARP